MSQLVIGAALGYIVAQGALHGIKRFVGWLQRDEVRQRIRTLTPSQGSIIGGFIRHAGLIAAGAAVITLGVWATRDYLAVRSARSAAIADTFDPATAAPVTDAPAPADEAPAPARARKPEPTRAVPVNNVDPYTDSDFQVHRRSQRAGTAASLKETLVRRSEEKARTDLLKETQQHVHRSQYDCEAADRASKYVKGGLDVWGFALWQVKYFPAGNYTGATLPQCKDIKNVVDPSWVDLKSTVAQANHS